MKLITSILIIAFIVSSQVSFSQTIYVDSASVCTTNCDGSSWLLAYNSLQDALSQVKGGDTICVAKGTYFPDQGIGITNNNRDVSFAIPDSVKLLGGFSSSTGQRDWLQNRTVLSGEIQQDVSLTNNSYHVLSTHCNSDQILIEGFTVCFGVANNSSVYPHMYGGGLFNYSMSNTISSPTIRACIFKSNYGIHGGAISTSGRSEMKIINCLFHHNSADKGGAIYLDASYNIFDMSTINCTFVYNDASTYGGGLFINTNTSNSSKCYLHNCILWGNTAHDWSYGPQVYNYSSDYQYPDFKNSIIEGCQGSANWYYSVGYNGGYNLDVYPYFKDTLTNNYSLSNCSPAIHAGINTSIQSLATKDLNNNTRIFNSTVDIGAYESQIYHGFSTISSISKTQNAGCSVFGIASVTHSSSNGIGLVSWDNGEITNTADSLSPGDHYVTLTNSLSGCWDSAHVFIPLTLTGSRIYVDSAATGIQSGCSWSDALTCLQDAIHYAGPFDSIFVAKGTYYPDEVAATNTNSMLASFQIPNNVSLFGGFSPANGVISFSQRDLSSYPCILSGDIHQDSVVFNNSYYVVRTAGVSSSTIMDGFVIEGGNSTLAGGWYNDGTVNSSPQIRNCVFRNNKGDKGGAIHNKRNCQPLIINCVFYDNFSYKGGAIYNDAYHGVCSPTIVNCTFSENQGPQGAAIFNFRQYGTSNVYISNCIFKNNTFNLGSGLIHNSNGVNTHVRNCILQTNSSFNWDLSQGIDDGFNYNYNPLFTNVTQRDFSLAPCSKAINGGDNSYYPVSTLVDVKGNSRFFNNGNVDIGAYEFLGNGSVEIDSVHIQNATCSNFGSAQLYCSALHGFEVLWDNGEITSIADSLVPGPHQVWVTDSLLFCRDSTTIYISLQAGISKIFVDSAASGYNNGCNWQNAFSDLQDAFFNAKAGDTIFVAEGSYYPHSLKRNISFEIPDSVILYGGFSPSNGVISLLQRDFKQYETILSGEIQRDNDSTNNSYHVVTSQYLSASTRVDGFTIKQGHADSTGIYKMGGGWYNGTSVFQKPSNPLIVNCTFKENYAFSSGGAFYNYGETESCPQLINCIFYNNHALINGGAIAFGKNYSLSNPFLVNCIFYNNAAQYGGAIHNLVKSSPDIINCTFSQNRAMFFGGAIYSMGNNSLPTLSNCILWGNICTNNSSYSEVFNDGAFPSYSHCTISGSGGSTQWNINIGTDAGGNIDLDPLFLGPSNNNFMLLSNSPAINTGDTIGLEIPMSDLNGNNRIVGSIIDMGCFEYSPTNINNGKKFLSFSLPGMIGQSSIDTINKEIEVTLPSSSVLTQLAASFSLSTHAVAFVNGVEQVSGSTALDYTDSIIYIVRAEDLSTQIWVVKVKIGQSISETGLKDIYRIYPNPTKGKCYIESSNKIQSVDLFSIHGILIRKYHFEARHCMLDLSSLASGAYIIQIMEEKKMTKKLIIRN